MVSQFRDQGTKYPDLTWITSVEELETLPAGIKPWHRHTIDHLEESGVKRRSVRQSSLKGRQMEGYRSDELMNLWTVWKATLGTLLSDGVEYRWREQPKVVFCCCCCFSWQKHFWERVEYHWRMLPQVYFCCDKYNNNNNKNMPVVTKICLFGQIFCRDKHIFVATKVFCRDKIHVYHFVATKFILVAAPASDR